MRLLIGRGAHRAGQDEAAEAGRKAFDLGFDPVGHVDVGAGRDVTVSPQRLLAGRGPGRIGNAGLNHQHVRVQRVLARRHFGLGRGDLLERAA